MPLSSSKRTQSRIPNSDDHPALRPLRKNQRQRILELLIAARGGEVPSPELAKSFAAILRPNLGTAGGGIRHHQPCRDPRRRETWVFPVAPVLRLANERWGIEVSQQPRITLSEPFPLLDPGQYVARCTEATYAWARQWKKWIARLVLEPQNYRGRPYTDSLCKFLGLGKDPQKPLRGTAEPFPAPAGGGERRPAHDDKRGDRDICWCLLRDRRCNCAYRQRAQAPHARALVQRRP